MLAVDHMQTDARDSEALVLVHQILVLDAFLAAPLDQTHCESITRYFISDLLNVLGMQALGDLGIFPAVDQREPGWSFIQPITTSHVSAHYFKNPAQRPHIRIDAYSCASIDWNKLIQVCHRHFKLDEWHASFIDRQLEHPQQRKVLELAGAGSKVTSESLLTNGPTPLQGEYR